MKIFQSATKITLLVLVFGLVVLSFMGIDINETYKTALLMVLSFYFGQKVNTTVQKTC
jgi:hypothetical protein